MRFREWISAVLFIIQRLIDAPILDGSNRMKESMQHCTQADATFRSGDLAQNPKGHSNSEIAVNGNGLKVCGTGWLERKWP